MVKELAGRNFTILTQKYSNKIKQILICGLQSNFNFDKFLTKEFANLYYKKNSTIFTSNCIYFFYCFLIILLLIIEITIQIHSVISFVIHTNT